MFIHSTKNNLNLRIKTVSVTVRADATMYRMTTVVSGQDTDVNKSRLHS